MNGLKRLFHSSKWLTALAGAAGAALSLWLGEEMGGQLSIIIVSLAGAYILGTTAEDVAKHLRGTKPEPKPK